MEKVFKKRLLKPVMVGLIGLNSFNFLLALSLADFFADLPWLLLIAVVAATIIFPIVFIVSFAYDALEKKYEDAPKILLMYACTIIGCVAAALLVYAYVGFTLQQIFAATAP